MTDYITNIHPPRGSMDLLSQIETDILKNTADGELYQLFRNCVLAILNTGSQTDSSHELFDQYQSFEANLIRTERGIKIELINPPQAVFVDGNLTQTIRKNLFSVLRDILFVKGAMDNYQRCEDKTIDNSAQLTNIVFVILRNARALYVSEDPDLVVCWGGHSISEPEYTYERSVGYELGLRELNICTGCGPGAMEAPMKGAAVGHAQQAYKNSRFIGITEPSIIAAEPPNPLVNELLIMPDIEKRLEAFVRLGHAIVIFPGGVGTAEEFLYILGILMMPENQQQYLPLILTGPKTSAAYFNTLDQFIVQSLGPEAQKYYQIIIDAPAEVAKTMKRAMAKVKENRLKLGDAYCFNWALEITQAFQTPFIPTHENMANLNLHKDQPKALLAANLRCAFSGIVAGNVKEFGIERIKQYGPYKLHGDPEIMALIDQLLQDFVQQQRMKLPGSTYVPCYEIMRD